MRTRALGLFLTLLASCAAPDTSSVIAAVTELARIEATAIGKHTELVKVATFSTDAAEQLDLQRRYLSMLAAHLGAHERLTRALLDWAQRVGDVDPLQVAVVMDQIVDIYVKLKEGM